MRTLQHTNLFHYAAKKDVYASMQRDFDRDTWIQMWWQCVFVGCALGAAFVAERADWLWLFGGVYALERAISRFVDNSNRNWFLHMVDWHESGWSSEEDSRNEQSGT